MFSVCIENSSERNYFTEKLIDCFAQKVIPIYWGAPNVSEFFDPDGIIFCKTHDQVIEKMIEVFSLRNDISLKKEKSQLLVILLIQSLVMLKLGESLKKNYKIKTSCLS
jgi:hypothetical protein